MAYCNVTGPNTQIFYFLLMNTMRDGICECFVAGHPLIRIKCNFDGEKLLQK